MTVYLTPERVHEKLVQIPVIGSTLENVAASCLAALKAFPELKDGYKLEMGYAHIDVFIERDETELEFKRREIEAEESRIRQERHDRMRYERLKQKFEDG